MGNLIELRNINKTIENQIILKNINLQIKKNEFVTLLGPSGCGKTTILKIIGGFTDLSSGTLLFNDQNVVNIPSHKRFVNTVFQKYALFSHFNVFENIAFSLRIKDLNADIKQKILKVEQQLKEEIKKLKNSFKLQINETKYKMQYNYFTWLRLWFAPKKDKIKIGQMKLELKKQIKKLYQKYELQLSQLKTKLLSKEEKKNFVQKKVLYYLKLVGLSGLENREISKLSGGQQQRVAIARALINEPKVLLLDEPLAALDLKLRQEMQYELKDIQKNSGITFIFVTHNQEEALTMSDKIVVINQGEIQQIGTPEDIYNEPANRFIAKFIGESNLISGIIKEDFLVSFDEQDFRCVDYGFNKDQPVDIVIRPEDIDIVNIENGLFSGIIISVLFKGVHWELIVQTSHRKYKVHTTDFIQINTQVGIFFQPEDLHVMELYPTYYV